MQETKGPNKAIAGIAVVVLLAIATTGVVLMTSKNDAAKQVSDTSATEKTSQPTSSGAGTNAATAGSYKDGTYKATGSYQTPGGRESIIVQLTLAGGVISDAAVTQQPITQEAHEYQAAFVSGYKAQVVGKKIDEVSLSRTAGSSLTPNGFNSALATIKSEAAA